MTDITDQDRRTAIDVAEAIERGDYPMAAMWPILARVILATVDAPDPTLADEIRCLPDFTMSGENCINDCHERADTLATRVDQMEHDLTEARAEAKTWREQDENDCEAYMEELASVREALAVEGRRVEKITQERDEAKKDRDHFFREVENVRNWKERLLNERDEARAEVERLTAVNENLRRTDNYRQFRDKFLTVQKGAESTAETPNPADVKPGEAWQVLIDDIEPTVAFSANGAGWCCYRSTHGTALPIGDERVTLVSRLVPAPRVITNPDELDRLPDRTIVRDKYDGAMQKINGRWVPARASDSRGLAYVLDPATVLWEPEA